MRLTDGKGLICIPSGNHDMDRLSRYLDEDELRVAFAFLLSMPGAPFIYYGDEIGMRYVEGLTSVEGGYGRTGSRSPMQWDKGLNAGFSSASAEKLYIPLDPAADRPDALTQMSDEGSLRSEVKRLIAFRQANPALRSRGGIKFLTDGAEARALIYKRTGGGQTITVIINPADKPVRIPEEFTSGGRVVYSVGSYDDARGQLTVNGCSAVFAELCPAQ